MLAGLNFKPVQQLLGHQFQHGLQTLVELLLVPVAFNGQPGQVDGGEGQVAPGVGDLPGGVVYIAHDPGAAAHGGNLGLRMTGDIVLQVEGGIQESVVGEQALGADLAAEPEQVIVGVALVVVDPFLHLENVDGENAGLPVSQTGIQRQQNVADHHPAFGSGIGAVVDGGEGSLGAGTGVHGVQVMDKALHGLLGIPVGFGVSPGGSPLYQFVRLGRIQIIAAAKQTRNGLQIRRITFQTGSLAGALFGLGNQLPNGSVLVGQIQIVLHRLLQPAGEGLAVGLGHPFGHAVIEVGDGLAAVLIVLIALDGDGGQSGVALNAVGLPEVAVAGGEAAVEQFEDVDLAAGGGQGIEVKVVDVDVALPVGLGVLRAEQVHLVVCLGSGSPDLEHGAHGGIAVDVGVVPLHVADPGIDVGDFIDGLHQGGVGLPSPGPIGPVENIGLGGGVEAMVHQLTLHAVLNGFNVGGCIMELALQIPLDVVGNPGGVGGVSIVTCLHGTQNGCGDFILIVQNHPAVPLDNALNHRLGPAFLRKLRGRWARQDDITLYIVFALKNLHNILPQVHRFVKRGRFPSDSRETQGGKKEKKKSVSFPKIRGIAGGLNGF